MSVQPQNLSLAEFLAWEGAQKSKHEYAEGSISAFPGVTSEHAAIVMYVAAALHARVLGTPCRVFVADMLTASLDSARYPDIVLTCDPRDTARGQRTARHPKLIVEVLSDLTAAVDRGPKLEEYRSIESLEEYALIDSRRRWAEVHRRSGKTWTALPPIPSGSLGLASVDLALDLHELYEYAGILPG